jgi:hypothetical protein
VGDGCGSKKVTKVPRDKSAIMLLPAHSPMRIRNKVVRVSNGVAKAVLRHPRYPIHSKITSKIIALRNERKLEKLNAIDNGGGESDCWVQMGNDENDNRNDGNGIMYRIGEEMAETNFVDGYSGDTLVLEIDLDKYGTFLGLTNSLRNIPEKFIKKTRAVFIKYLRELIKNITVLVSWKKVLLLSIVLFGGYCGESTMKSQYEVRLEQLLSDNWDSFSLGMFRKRENSVAQVEQSAEKRLEKMERQN